MKFGELKINSYKRQSERKKISLLKSNNNSFCKNKEFFLQMYSMNAHQCQILYLSVQICN